jgi:hypothetical protein
VGSKSKPGTFHQVKRDITNGVVWCDCMAWRFSKSSPKTCRHCMGVATANVMVA